MSLPKVDQTIKNSVNQVMEAEVKTTENEKPPIPELLEALKKRNYDYAVEILESLEMNMIKESLSSFNVTQLCQQVPYSLNFIKSLYSRLFLDSANSSYFPCSVLKPQETALAIVRHLFCAESSKPSAVSFTEQYNKQAEQILKIIACVSPRTVQVLRANQETIYKHLKGLGSHSLVLHDSQMLQLHDALYSELSSLINQYKQALSVLQMMNLVSKKVISTNIATSNSQSSPTKTSRKPLSPTSPTKSHREPHHKISETLNHQKLLDVNCEEIQERLFKNKAFLNVIEPSFKSSGLNELYESLCDRVDLDKDVLVLFNQVCKDTDIPISHSVKLGSRLQAYREAIERALAIMQSEDGSGLSSNQKESGFSSNASIDVLKESIAIKSDGCGKDLPDFAGKGQAKEDYNIHASAGAWYKNENALPKRFRKRHKSPRPTLVYLESSDKFSHGSSDKTTELMANESRDVSLLDESRASCPPNESDLIKDNSSTPKSESLSKNEPSELSQTTGLNAITSVSAVKISNGGDVSNDSDTETCSKSPAANSRSVKFKNSLLQNGIDVASSSSDVHKQVSQLKTELEAANRTIKELRHREQQLLERISEQVRLKVEKSGSFEALNDDNRPSQLIQRYSDLYCEMRPEAMDALDEIIGVSEMDSQEVSGCDSANIDSVSRSNDLKQKILFSIVVLSFRSVQRSIEQTVEQIFVLLGVDEADLEKTRGVNAFSLQNSDSDSCVVEDESCGKSEILRMVTEQLRKSASSRDIGPNYEEVCKQLWATLFDYPSLKSCGPLLSYMKECVRLAWLLLLANPAYHISYHHTTFNQNVFNRFHTSDLQSQSILSFIWPALVEQNTGHCVSKGIVVT